MQNLRGLPRRRLQIMRLLQRHDKIWRSWKNEANLREGDLHDLNTSNAVFTFHFASSGDVYTLSYRFVPFAHFATLTAGLVNQKSKARNQIGLKENLSLWSARFVWTLFIQSARRRKVQDQAESIMVRTTPESRLKRHYS